MIRPLVPRGLQRGKPRFGQAASSVLPKGRKRRAIVPASAGRRGAPIQKISKNLQIAHDKTLR
jgi:hypothetical protein